MGKFSPKGAIIARMRTCRVVVSIFALAAICTAGAMRADESPPAEPVQIAQARDAEAQTAQPQAAERTGEDRLSTLGDLRHMESRTDAQISGVRAEMRALREDMNEQFYTLLAVMVALFGLPQLPGWLRQLRENGKPAVAAGIFLVVLAAAAGGAAVAAW